MKKTYVFLNRRIYGIDGSIQYIYNKSQFLKTLGYDVIVFSVQRGKILIKEFEQFQPYIFPEMQYCPSMFRSSERDTLLSHVVSILIEVKSDEIIIESTSPVSAVWGELIAQRLGCKHVFFYLFERTDIAQDLRDFCWFKYNREEFYGITNKTVPMVLQDETVLPSKIAAYCNNVFADCVDLFSKKLDRSADYTFGSIGRLEKPCVPVIAEELFHYFEKNSHHNYNFIMIGGDGKGKEAQLLHEKFRNCQNVTFIITDFLYPIPNSLIDRIDLFVSTAGSANATYRHEKPTIRVHPISGKVLGIIGCDFALKDKSMFESENDLTMEDCVDRVLRKEAEIHYLDTSEDEYNSHMIREFSRQLDIARSGDMNEYYDLRNLYKIKTPFVRFHAMRKVLCAVAGGMRLQKMIDLIKNEKHF